MTTEQNKSPPISDIWPTILSRTGLAGPLSCRAAVCIINETCNPGLRHGDAYNVTASLIAQVIHRETGADQLAEALLEMHLYGQTDFAYLRSPAAAKTHNALVSAGYLTPEGYLTDLAKSRGQQ